MDLSDTLSGAHQTRLNDISRNMDFCPSISQTLFWHLKQADWQLLQLVSL
jgi:hypothetical protein